jgi:hypothetical protein
MIKIEHTIVTNGAMSNRRGKIGKVYMVLNRIFNVNYDERGGRNIQQVKQYLSFIGCPRMVTTLVLGWAHSSFWKNGSKKEEDIEGELQMFLFMHFYLILGIVFPILKPLGLMHGELNIKRKLKRK